MREGLRSSFSKEQLELAAAIGESDEACMKKVQQVFGDLGDPLLSEEDIHELLAKACPREELSSALNALEADGTLERSEGTFRPLDPSDVVLYRRAGAPVKRLKIMAVQDDLGSGKTSFHFTCDGRLIRSIARIDRLNVISGEGQQRDEIERHVRRIAEGIEAGNRVPNSILLVLLEESTMEDPDDDPPESFVIVRSLSDWMDVPHPTQDTGLAQRFRTVELDIPFRTAAFDEEKTALLVDGQQRTAALSLVDIDKVSECHLSVNAVIADGEEAKKVFSIANSTQKIQTQFSRALLATMDEAPGYLRAEQAKAVACKVLALEDVQSPFKDLVQHPGLRRTPRPPIAYNSLFQVVVLFAESALPIEDDPQEMARLISRGFQAVKKAWPDAWGLKPSESRLMHGVGLRAIGAVVVSKLEMWWSEVEDEAEVWRKLDDSLDRLRTKIIWTDKEMATAPPAVKRVYRDEIIERQNTSQDIRDLTSFVKKESLALDTKAATARKKAAKRKAGATTGKKPG